MVGLALPPETRRQRRFSTAYLAFASPGMIQP